MSDKRVAYRYAKSILELSVENNILEEVHDSFLLVKDTLTEARDLRVVLSNPIVQTSKKLAVLQQVFEGKVHDLVITFFTVMCRKGREAFLYSTAVVFHELYNKHQGIQEATVISAVALSSEQRDEIIRIVKEVTLKSVELTEKVDERIMGGFVLRIDDREIDDSVRTRLQDMRSKLIV